MSHFSKLPTEIVDDGHFADMSLAEFKVYFVIIRGQPFRPGGKLKPLSHRQISQISKLNQRTVERATISLREKGLICRTPDSYLITLPTGPPTGTPTGPPTGTKTLPTGPPTGTPTGPPTGTPTAPNRAVKAEPKNNTRSESSITPTGPPTGTKTPQKPPVSSSDTLFPAEASEPYRDRDNKRDIIAGCKVIGQTIVGIYCDRYTQATGEKKQVDAREAKQALNLLRAIRRERSKLDPLDAARYVVDRAFKLAESKQFPFADISVPPIWKIYVERERLYPEIVSRLAERPIPEANRVTIRELIGIGDTETARATLADFVGRPGYTELAAELEGGQSP